MKLAMIGAVLFLFGVALGTVFNRDYLNDLEQENRHLKGILRPFKVSCEPGEIWVATKADNEPWKVRCVSGPRRKK